MLFGCARESLLWLVAIVVAVVVVRTTDDRFDIANRENEDKCRRFSFPRSKYLDTFPHQSLENDREKITLFLGN